MPRTNVHSLTPSPLNVQLTLSGGKVNMSTAFNIIFVRNRFERRMGLDRKKKKTTNKLTIQNKMDVFILAPVCRSRLMWRDRRVF